MKTKKFTRELLRGMGNGNLRRPLVPPMGRALRPGEEVTWNTSQGESRAIKRSIQRGEDHEAASTDNSEHVVESRKRAAHKRSALKKS